MKKPYLLLAGMGYYPSAYTGDWHGCFETRELAQQALDKLESYQKDWFEIVDLRKWTDED